MYFSSESSTAIILQVICSYNERLLAATTQDQLSFTFLTVFMLRLPH